ncbi:hypothetical protein EVAR_5597_1 [Eumeta japonica]|uniref:Uncharacterized protein n=1 Tax=Eumeta variegata TaxID=151549 RepID=A0A4C1U2V7_EUMVA|nr:hypothetical protein EVAR_5597_1 [Eumeta japonica]
MLLSCLRQGSKVEIYMCQECLPPGLDIVRRSSLPTLPRRTNWFILHYGRKGACVPRIALRSNRIRTGLSKQTSDTSGVRKADGHTQTTRTWRRVRIENFHLTGAERSTYEQNDVVRWKFGCRKTVKKLHRTCDSLGSL